MKFLEEKKIPSELKMILYILSLYSIFIYWGYLQEKLTSTKYSIFKGKFRPKMYKRPSVDFVQWQYSFVLNLSMAFVSCVTAVIVDSLFPSNIVSQLPPASTYWKAALSSALASPIGYTSLRYINYPLMILTKSSKPVPVMFIGTLFYQKKYSWYKYMGTALVCTGISLFTLFKEQKQSNNSGTSSEASYIYVGIFLVLLNLTLDGYTNNEQDFIFTKYSVPPLEMMKYTNFWQVAYLCSFLFLGWLWYGSESEASKALEILIGSKDARTDILSFSLCAAVGQILILCLIKEFGSLVWVTVSITRQLFTILLSVFAFRHSVSIIQWMGVLLVFGGLGLDLAFSNQAFSSPSTSKESSSSKSTSFSTTSTMAVSTGTNSTAAYMRKGGSSTPSKSLSSSFSTSEDDIESGDAPAISKSKIVKGKKKE